MFTSEEMLAELAQESVVTRVALERVPEARYGWRPHPKAQTAGQLAHHVAVIPMALAGVAMQERFLAGHQPPRPEPASRAELMALYEQNIARAREVLGGLDHAALVAPWRLVQGEQVILEIPRSAFIRTILFNHWYHHRGQLSTYLRMLDVRVPAIYGPSSDELPFG
jgi:uncharacterized damage-inducible protein DinB